MNLDNIKKDINNYLGKKVLVKVYGMRNKTDIFEGYITNAYPNIFTIDVDGENKSFRYADILTGEIHVKYL